MLAQRTTQQSLRRLAASVSKPSIASQMLLKQVAVSSSSIQTRPATSQATHNIIAAKDSHSILAKQRLNRPTAPHLLIYKPQITSVLSISNRITGGILSAGFYVLGLSYLASPLLGWHMDSASMAAAFASWPVFLQYATKFAVAFPFTFHSFNGIRHLVWDTGRQFKNKVVIRTGWTVVGLATVSALGLTFMA